LQVNGALQAKPQANTGVTVNIGFLTAPGAPPSVEVLTIDHSSTVKELTQVMSQHPQVVPSEG
jgi:hypothetical protein